MEVINTQLYEDIYTEYEEYTNIKTKKCKEMYLKYVAVRNKNIDKEMIKRCIDEKKLEALDRIWIKRKYEIKENCDVNILAKEGNLEILKWIYNKSQIEHFEFKYDDRAVVNAMSINRLDIIEWFWEKSKTDNLKFKYCHWGMSFAGDYGYLDVIEWFYNKHKTDKLKFDYDCEPVEFAAGSGHLNVIEWFYDKWRKDGLNFLYREEAVDWAAGHGHLNVIEWFYEKNKEHGVMIPFIYTEDGIDTAIWKGHLNVIDWFWEKSKTDNLKFKYTKSNLFKYKFSENSYEIGKWLEEKGLIKNSSGFYCRKS